MLTINTILKEINDIPLNRLDEVYEFVHSLKINTQNTEEKRKKILAFGGSFNDMSKDDYKDFIEETIKTRANTFNRNVDL